ncbi:nucleoside diphosphate kinase regulator [Herbaspirillum sp. HC18]|nr:nucleoside diphosphate kinase regulator [Herbaspirillum sp. HC18]
MTIDPPLKHCLWEKLASMEDSPRRIELIRNRTTANAITISETDHYRIHDFLSDGSRRLSPVRMLLEKKLEIARVVQPNLMPSDVVTLNSLVLVHETVTDAEYGFRLVIPGATSCIGDVSILTPVGTAALGMRLGQEIFWYGRSGRKVGLRILDIVYQPEAMGHYHL